MTSEFLESIIRAQALELVDRDLIIKAQAGVIKDIQDELDKLRNGGKRLIETLMMDRLEAQIQHSRLHREYIKLKDAYFNLLELVGKNGGGGKMTLLRADYFIRYLIAMNPRVAGIVRSDGKKYLTSVEITHMLKHTIDDFLKLNPEVIHIKQAVIFICKTILKEAKKRGIPITRHTQGVGQKVWVLVYDPAKRLDALPEPKKTKTNRTLKEAKEDAKQVAGWARGYRPFFRDLNRPEKPDSMSRMTQADMFAKWSSDG